MQIRDFNHLLEVVKKQPKKKLVTVNGVDENTLEALDEAVNMGLVSATLTGDQEKIEEACSKLDIDLQNYEIIHTKSEKESIEKAVKMIHDGQAGLIMKGMVTTDKFMKVLLKKEYELVPSKGVISHVALMSNPTYHKLLIFSDAGVIPYPNLEQKIQMTRYVIQTAFALGIEKPKVAIIAPTEKIIISIQSLLH